MYMYVWLGNVCIGLFADNSPVNQFDRVCAWFGSESGQVVVPVINVSKPYELMKGPLTFDTTR